MEVFFLWLFLAGLVGALAGARGRSSGRWFLLSMVLSPLIGLIGVLATENRAAIARQMPVDAPTPQTHVRCPDCRELVHKDARKCKHCGCALVPQT